jgi:septal ring factor EnvC (AmiA/AmiB activator)
MSKDEKNLTTEEKSSSSMSDSDGQSKDSSSQTASQSSSQSNDSGQNATDTTSLEKQLSEATSLVANLNSQVEKLNNDLKAEKGRVKPFLELFDKLGIEEKERNPETLATHFEKQKQIINNFELGQYKQDKVFALEGLELQEKQFILKNVKAESKESFDESLKGFLEDFQKIKAKDEQKQKQIFFNQTKTPTLGQSTPTALETLKQVGLR